MPDKLDPEVVRRIMEDPRIGGWEKLPETIGQYEDGTWYWLDETWNYGDDIRYPSREAASKAQGVYCREVLGI